MTMRFDFSKVIRLNIVVGLSFPDVVRDNVVSNDNTITSSLRIDVTIGISSKFSIFLVK